MGISVNENIIEEIKNRCNIVDVIGRVVTLKKAGNNYKGVCPFHNEKTPSFVVSDAKQIFTCFGCGATGDVIEFTQKYYNLDFQETIERLANEYGINFEYNKSSVNKEKYYEINREAAIYFYKQFNNGNNPGYEYMIKRGIEPAILKKFGVGYADDSWNSLYDYLINKGIEKDMLLELGLISEVKGKYFNKFRNRVIFPIINTRGKIIGFGGRILGDGNPKYLNSPETPIFQKKNNLYGVNITRQDISKENCAILVEGYMDVISLYQAGVRNVSASLGTALTENQAKLLKRYTGNIVLSYDSDEAGQAAAIRGIEILHNENCKVKVLHIGDGKDPDEFVKKNGKTAYLELIDKALPYVEYKLEMLKKQFDISDTDGRVDYVKEAVTILKALSPIEADIYIKKLAKDLKVSEGAIRLEITGNNNFRMVNNTRSVYKKAEDVNNKISPLEKNIIKLILTDSKYLEEIVQYGMVFESKQGSNIFNTILSLRNENDEIDIKRLQDSVEPEESSVLIDIIENVKLAGVPEKVFEESKRSIKEKVLKKKEKELVLKLSLADEEENQEKIKEYTLELMEIQKIINL